MDGELEIAGVDSAGGFLRWRQKHALPPGALCRNCGTGLRGAWCYHCGQLGEDFHRSAHHLIGEAFEGFFHADGRLFRTLPLLVLRPARLTRTFIEGKRAPQIPPLRLFLVTLLIVFLVGSLTNRVHVLRNADMGGGTDRATAKAEIQKMNVDIGGGPVVLAAVDWLKAHLPLAIDHPDALVAGMGEWAHRFAFMTLPVSALLLAMIFVFRRDLYLFDHLIFSMHSLSFQGLLFSLVMGFGDAVAWLLLASPVHLFFHMRGFYGTGVFGTLVRMWVLFVASAVAFGLLLLGLVLIALNTLQSAS